MATKSLVFSLIGHDVSASKALKGVGKHTSGLASSFKSLAGVVGIAFSARAIVNFGQESVNAFLDAEKSQNQLQDAFKRFPKLADINIGSLRKLNTQLSLKTKFDDDATASGQAVLAQFGLTGKQLEKLTPLLQDYAAKTGRDLPTAATVLGKAFLGNTRALKELGIKYTSTGDFATDFTNITALMRAKVGGFAEKEGKTAGGRLEIMRTQFGELKEKIGGALMPILSKLADWLLKDGIPRMSRFVDWVVKNKDQIIFMAGAIGGLWAGLKILTGIMKLTTAAQWLLNAAMNANPIGAVILLVTGLIAVTKYVTDNFTRLRKELVKGKFSWEHLLLVMSPAAGLVFGINEAVRNGTKHWKGLQQGITRFTADFARNMTSFVGGIRRWSATTGANIATVLAKFAAIPRRVMGYFGRAKRWLFGAGRDVIQGFWNGLTFIWRKLTKWIGGIAGWIKKNKGPLSLDRSLLVPAGRAIMGGFQSGLQSGFEPVQKFVGSVGRRMQGSVGRWSGMVSRALSMLGQSQSLIPAVLRRINMESGGNPNAINLWDSNAKAGHPSRGLMQTIPTTFAAYAGPFRGRGIYDPMASIFAGLNYALSRYGSIRAIDPLVRPIGYALGGTVGRSGSYMVGERGPERVVLPRGSRVIPNHRLQNGDVNVIIQSKGGIDLSKYIEVKIEQADQANARRIRMG